MIRLVTPLGAVTLRAGRAEAADDPTLLAHARLLLEGARIPGWRPDRDALAAEILIQAWGPSTQIAEVRPERRAAPPDDATP